MILAMLLAALQAGESGWQVLSGPEKEKGDPVEILSQESGNLTLSVRRKRGTVIRSFKPTSLPATITFQFESTYDAEASEPPTELFGTGDFRLFVGARREGDQSLTAFEGFQFRIFPHLGSSPVRRKTGDESHTATSIWIRYADPRRRTDGLGKPHAGLLSDACQRRNKQKGTHNCGWARVLLESGGLGLKNGAAVEMTIRISKDEVSLEAGKHRFSHRLKEGERRLKTLTTFGIGHANTSRGYRTVKISDLKCVGQ